jgi:uncharacterized protein YndB with AHSA1/START domain
MSNASPIKTDSKLDLVFERVVDVPPERVWAAWTTPEQIKKWFTPDPWKTIECEIDLRPGGEFRTVMQSPEGQNYPNVGCYLEIVPNRRLVWTDMLTAGFRPADKQPSEHAPIGFTAIVSMEPQGNGTKYTATAMHMNPEDRKKHEGMGFHEGWGKALEQLVLVAKKLRG